MFKKIKNFFLNMNSVLRQNHILTEAVKKDVSFLDHKVNFLVDNYKQIPLHIQKDIAGIQKTLSSIEMELLLARGACLDNNFEGKESM